ncbi:hypothetical protein Glove_374g12 [Diversispora epigaea]|uniref:Uncharacterized protein n=1 Tax=Diversispora epigaea TaxID=1348612 RepID=A0A397H9D4_9GLOM|nr:hypothetical protein Glove_374g12 [Diversispora epigaea]
MNGSHLNGKSFPIYTTRFIITISIIKVSDHMMPRKGTFHRNNDFSWHPIKDLFKVGPVKGKKEYIATSCFIIKESSKIIAKQPNPTTLVYYPSNSEQRKERTHVTKWVP